MLLAWALPLAAAGGCYLGIVRLVKSEVPPQLVGAQDNTVAEQQRKEVARTYVLLTSADILNLSVAKFWWVGHVMAKKKKNSRNNVLPPWHYVIVSSGSLRMGRGTKRLRTAELVNE